MTPSIERVRFDAASDAARIDGLIGYVSFEIDGFVELRGVMVRRTRQGRLLLSFPKRPDRLGRLCDVVRPTNGASREEIERAVFRAIGIDGVGSP